MTHRPGNTVPALHLLVRVLGLFLALFAPPVLADGLLNCADFWSAGSPLTGDGDHPCYEHPQPFDSDRIRLFVEPDWLNETRLSRVNAVARAVADSMDAFEELAEMGPVYVLFAAEDLPIPDDRNWPYPAAVQSHFVWPQGGEPCPMLVFPWGIEGWDESDMKQQIAHETFHCFQVNHFYQQLRGTEFGAQAWWSEGTATYFINAPYPDGDFEHVPQALYDPAHSLVEQSYANTGFFQSYKASGPGRTGILSLIEAMPTGGDSVDQHAALSGIAGIGEHFHTFGERYLDRRIPDDGGGHINIAPEESPVTVIDESGNYEFEAAPFTLGHHRLRFSAGGRYRLQLRQVAGEGRQSWRTAESPGAWQELPDSIDVDCARDEDYLFLTTSTAGPDENQRLVLTVEREAREDCCDSGANLDPRMVGTFVALGNQLIDQVYPLEGGDKGATGSITIYISERGDFAQVYDGVVVSMTRDWTNAPPITFTDSSSGIVRGCLDTRAVGAMGGLSIRLMNRSANVARVFSDPDGRPHPTDKEHIGLAFGVPGEGRALGMVKPVDDGFYNKKVLYQRVDPNRD